MWSGEVKLLLLLRDRKLDVENAVKMAAEDDGFVTYQGYIPQGQGQGQGQGQRLKNCQKDSKC